MAGNGNIAQYIIDALSQQQGSGMAAFPNFQLPQQMTGNSNDLLQYIDQLDREPVSMTPPMQQGMAMPQMPMAPQAMSQPQPMGGPQTVPTKNVSSYIQEALGAKEPTSGDFLQSILSRNNSGPSFDDYGRAIQKSAYDTPTGAQDYADANMKNMFEQLATLEKLQGGSEFDKLINTYQGMAANDPRRGFYEARIKKETTPGASALVQVYNPTTKQLEFASPEQIATGGYQPPKAAPTLSATQQKEIFDTTDVITNSENAKAALERARNLSQGMYGAKPYSGAGSETWAATDAVPGAGLFVDDERAAATDEYNTLIKEQALSTMKAIFGGNPTEGERQVLLSIQGLSSKTPAQQQRIIDNAIRAIDRRIGFSQNKIKAIEGGDNAALANPTGNTAPTNNGPDLNDPGFQEFLRSKGLVQ